MAGDNPVGVQTGRPSMLPAVGAPQVPVPLSCVEALDARDVIRLVQELVPEWAALGSQEITAEPIVGGITNKTFRVYHNANMGEVCVLVRIFGAEGVISKEARSRENSIFAQLGEMGIAPKLLGLFANGRVESWISARRADLGDMSSNELISGVAAEMAALHKFCPEDEVNTVRTSNVWSLVEGWLSEGRKLNLGVSEADVPLIADEFSKLQRVILEESPASPLVFAHNDLLAGNILLGDKTYLIDYEYASTNYRGFDIGNFFCEVMGGTDDGIVQRDRYPSSEKQTLFCRIYLRHASGCEPSNEEIQALVREANQFGLLASLYWAAWAIVQSSVSTVDFPYLLFARNRLNHYLETKDLHLSRASPG